MPFALSRASVLALFASALAAVACQSRPAAPPPQKTVSPDVWAVVDGREIKRDAVEKAYRRTIQPNQQVSGDEAVLAKLNILDEVILDDIIAAKARELKIEPSASEIDAAFNEGKKNIPEATFNQELAARSLTAADMRDGVRRDLTVQKV